MCRSKQCGQGWATGYNRVLGKDSGRGNLLAIGASINAYKSRIKYSKNQSFTAKKTDKTFGYLADFQYICIWKSMYLNYYGSIVDTWLLLASKEALQAGKTQEGRKKKQASEKEQQSLDYPDLQ